MVRSEGQRQLREKVKAGTRQRDIAIAIGCAKGTVSSLVSGRHAPDLMTALGLYKNYGIPPEAWAEKPKRNGKAA